MSGHNIVGEPTTEIIPTSSSRETGLWGKKRYGPFHDTNLGFLLDAAFAGRYADPRGINTTSCVLCCGFERRTATTGVVVAADASIR